MPGHHVPKRVVSMGRNIQYDDYGKEILCSKAIIKPKNGIPVITSERPVGIVPMESSCLRAEGDGLGE